MPLVSLLNLIGDSNEAIILNTVGVLKISERRPLAAVSVHEMREAKMSTRSSGLTSVTVKVLFANRSGVGVGLAVGAGVGEGVVAAEPVAFSMTVTVV